MAALKALGFGAPSAGRARGSPGRRSAGKASYGRPSSYSQDVYRDDDFSEGNYGGMPPRVGYRF